ncbi:unnamed protein product [Parnassius apollo]|uniref:(apollo) hypothetical protein n=1 Tax=Parnassius apollo TaxID=110799 RepID=A0A8S3Y0L6_PARAO|nr:unnamed protein product [Parnassius apollo]
MELPESNNRVRRLVQCCRRKIKEQIHSNKNKIKWNWPELHLYCGICDLKTGLYIRSVISVLVCTTILVMNCYMVYFMLDHGKFLFELDVAEYLDVNFSDVTLEKIKKLHTLVLSYMFVWIIFKILYILAIFLTFYAVYKKKPMILKYVLYINTFNWILDIFFSALGAAVAEIMSKAVFVICVLFEGYNLIAISSQYKQLRGKSKLLLNESNSNHNLETASSTSSVATTNTTQPPIQTQPYCQTCSCRLNPVFTRNSETANTSSVESATSSNPDALVIVNEFQQKGLNIKDIDIIFNQDQLLPRESTVFENVQCANTSVVVDFQRLSRPTNLELPPPYKEKKVDLTDDPVIYDEDQLQISGSPVVENRRENEST